MANIQSLAFEKIIQDAVTLATTLIEEDADCQRFRSLRGRSAPSGFLVFH
ncbi:hypothetical protein [Sphingosinicella xenopeptidilytica]|uniref:Transposase n=1 Tax=Sphingosinicella xenopeptidilytica TaxID=364098 RepID=A0ABW3C6A9_SPHXN